MPVINNMTTTLTSCNGNATITLIVSTSPTHVSLSCDNYSGSIAGVSQLWTVSAGSTMSSTTSHNINPRHNYTFPIMMVCNSADCIGYITITTAGVITFRCPTTPLIGTAGFYPFSVVYALL
jgi:hypothetical protein